MPSPQSWRAPTRARLCTSSGRSASPRGSTAESGPRVPVPGAASVATSSFAHQPLWLACGVMSIVMMTHRPHVVVERRLPLAQLVVAARQQPRVRLARQLSECRARSGAGSVSNCIRKKFLRRIAHFVFAKRLSEGEQALEGLAAVVGGPKILEIRVRDLGKPIDE